MSAPTILEQGDIGRRATARDRTTDEIVEIAENISFSNSAAHNGLHDIADPRGGFPAVDKDQGAARGLVIGLARLRRVAPNQVQMDTRSQIAAFDERLVRARTR